MSRQRDRREAQALAFVRRNDCASALEIGAAAVRGESRGGAMSWKGKEAIGLAVAIALTRRGILRATRGNMFKVVSRLHSRGFSALRQGAVIRGT